MNTCSHIDETRDYAMGDLGAELDAAARQDAEKHLAGCGECSAELAGLQFTATALRAALPDREIPQRIGFVSDKIFEPSLASRWFSSGWLGFASACVLSAAIVFAVSNRPAPLPQPVVMQAGLSKADVDRAISEAVAQVKAEDAKATASILAVADQKHEQEHRALMLAMEENLTILQKRLSTYTMLASSETGRFGDSR